MKLSGAFWHLSQPYCDEAFAKQFTAPSYTTFVAMPFGNSNKYNADDIYRRLKKEGLVEAAKLFEEETRLYITQVSASLTSDAISMLNIYGRLWKDRRLASQKPSIFQSVAGRDEYNKVFAGEIGRVVFEQAVRELIAHRLLWTDYQSNVAPGADSFGHHATELGWRVIEHIWQHDPLMRKPAGAPTGPNTGVP